MNHAQGEHWIIEGINDDGQRFRPSDWIERLSATLASFGSDNRLRYDRNVQPCVIEGQRCLCVGNGLSEYHPHAHAFIMTFARENRLRVQSYQPRNREDDAC
jgi:hypothetical protein